MWKLASRPLLALGLALLGCAAEVTESPSRPTDEFTDDAGRCRRALEPHLFGCASSLDDAFAASSLCGVVCAAPAGSHVVYFDDCTPTVRCAYDRDTSLLAGAYLEGEVPDHCGFSHAVIGGELAPFVHPSNF